MLTTKGDRTLWVPSAQVNEPKLNPFLACLLAENVTLNVILSEVREKESWLGDTLTFNPCGESTVSLYTASAADPMFVRVLLIVLADFNVAMAIVG